MRTRIPPRSTQSLNNDGPTQALFAAFFPFSDVNRAHDEMETVFIKLRNTPYSRSYLNEALTHGVRLVLTRELPEQPSYDIERTAKSIVDYLKKEGVLTPFAHSRSKEEACPKAYAVLMKSICSYARGKQFDENESDDFLYRLCAKLRVQDNQWSTGFLKSHIKNAFELSRTGNIETSYPDVLTFTASAHELLDFWKGASSSGGAPEEASFKAKDDRSWLFYDPCASKTHQDIEFNKTRKAISSVRKGESTAGHEKRLLQSATFCILSELLPAFDSRYLTPLAGRIVALLAYKKDNTWLINALGDMYKGERGDVDFTILASNIDKNGIPFGDKALEKMLDVKRATSRPLLRFTLLNLVEWTEQLIGHCESGSVLDDFPLPGLINPQEKAAEPSVAQGAFNRVKAYDTTTQAVKNVVRTLVPGIKAVNETAAYQQNQEDRAFLIESCIDHILKLAFAGQQKDLMSSGPLIKAASDVFGDEAEGFLLRSINEQARRIRLNKEVAEAKYHLSASEEKLNKAEGELKKAKNWLSSGSEIKKDPHKLFNASETMSASQRGVEDCNKEVNEAKQVLKKTQKSLKEYDGTATGINFDALVSGEWKNLGQKLQHIKERAEQGTFRFSPDMPLSMQLLEALASSFEQASSRLAAQVLGGPVYAKTQSEADGMKEERRIQDALLTAEAFPQNIRDAWKVNADTPLLPYEGMPESEQEKIRDEISQLRIITDFLAAPGPDRYEDATAAIRTFETKGKSSAPPHQTMISQDSAISCIQSPELLDVRVASLNGFLSAGPEIPGSGLSGLSQSINRVLTIVDSALTFPGAAAAPGVGGVPSANCPPGTFLAVNGVCSQEIEFDDGGKYARVPASLPSQPEEGIEKYSDLLREVGLTRRQISTVTRNDSVVLTFQASSTQSARQQRYAIDTFLQHLESGEAFSSLGGQFVSLETSIQGAALALQTALLRKTPALAGIPYTNAQLNMRKEKVIDAALAKGNVLTPLSLMQGVVDDLQAELADTVNTMDEENRKIVQIKSALQHYVKQKTSGQQSDATYTFTGALASSVLRDMYNQSLKLKRQMSYETFINNHLVHDSGQGKTLISPADFLLNNTLSEQDVIFPSGLGHEGESVLRGTRSKIQVAQQKIEAAQEAGALWNTVRTIAQPADFFIQRTFDELILRLKPGTSGITPKDVVTFSYRTVDPTLPYNLPFADTTVSFTLMDIYLGKKREWKAQNSGLVLVSHTGDEGLVAALNAAEVDKNYDQSLDSPSLKVVFSRYAEHVDMAFRPQNIRHVRIFPEAPGLVIYGHSGDVARGGEQSQECAYRVISLLTGQHADFGSATELDLRLAKDETLGRLFRYHFPRNYQGALALSGTRSFQTAISSEHAEFRRIIDALPENILTRRRDEMDKLTRSQGETAYDTFSYSYQHYISSGLNLAATGIGLRFPVLGFVLGQLANLPQRLAGFFSSDDDYKPGHLNDEVKKLIVSFLPDTSPESVANIGLNMRLMLPSIQLRAPAGLRLREDVLAKLEEVPDEGMKLGCLEKTFVLSNKVACTVSSPGMAEYRPVNDGEYKGTFRLGNDNYIPSNEGGMQPVFSDPLNNGGFRKWPTNALGEKLSQTEFEPDYTKPVHYKNGEYKDTFEPPCSVRRGKRSPLACFSAETPVPESWQNTPAQRYVLQIDLGAGRNPVNFEREVRAFARERDIPEENTFGEMPGRQINTPRSDYLNLLDETSYLHVRIDGPRASAQFYRDSAAQLAALLQRAGLARVGVLKIHTFVDDNEVYLRYLMDELVRHDIRVGYLNLPVAGEYLNPFHAWDTMRGNTDIEFGQSPYIASNKVISRMSAPEFGSTSAKTCPNPVGRGTGVLFEGRIFKRSNVSKKNQEALMRTINFYSTLPEASEPELQLFYKERVNGLGEVSDTAGRMPTLDGQQKRARMKFDAGRVHSGMPAYSEFNTLPMKEKLDCLRTGKTREGRELNDAQKGAIWQKASDEFWEDQMGKQLLKAERWRASAGQESTEGFIFPQGGYLKAPEGMCYPATLLMVRATEGGMEHALAENLMRIYDAGERSPLLSAMEAIYQKVKMDSIGSKIMGVQKSNFGQAGSRVKLFPMEDESVAVLASFPLKDTTEDHVVLMSRMPDGKYMYFDPNYGVIKFKSFSGMADFFKKNIWGYSALKVEYDVADDAVSFRRLERQKLNSLKVNGRTLAEIITHPDG